MHGKPALCVYQIAKRDRSKFFGRIGHQFTVKGLSAVKVKTIVFLSAIVTAYGAAAAGSPSGAIVLIVGHILFWQNHAIEVKLNRLLDASGLIVMQADIDA